MAEQKNQHLNQLLHKLPPGLLVGSDWLQAQGLSRSRIHDYVARGWLERLMPRVYRRPPPAAGPSSLATSMAPPPPIRWEIAVVSAQALADEPLHVGGATALDLLGLSHYLDLGRKSRIRLYDPERTAPAWLSRLPLDVPLLLTARRLFSDHSLGVEWRRFELGTGRVGAPVETPERHEHWDQFMRIAGPERSAIELMDGIGNDVGFRSADNLFQGLSNLRPGLLMRLLERCTSVKAKRLFLCYADRHGHAWAKRLEPERVDLGRGKRQIARGGRLDPRYHITVPAELIRDELPDGG